MPQWVSQCFARPLQQSRQLQMHKVVEAPPKFAVGTLNPDIAADNPEAVAYSTDAEAFPIPVTAVSTLHNQQPPLKCSL